jgi:predicted SnoaL-like aldol condensation-catalyzing enzyme
VTDLDLTHTARVWRRTQEALPARPQRCSDERVSDHERNKKIVTEFLDLAFNQKRPADAFARYVGAEYVQHNPHAPDGAEASADHLAAFLAATPQLRLDIRRVVAEDDLVVTHSLMAFTPDDRGHAVMDIVRISEGRIVEHWDVSQPVPASPANPNTMF